MNNEVISTEILERLHQQLITYIESYYKKVNSENCKEVFSNFNKEWQKLLPYIVDTRTEDRVSLYGKSLLIFSVAIFEHENSKEEDVILLQELIDNFDNDPNVKYQFPIKQSLFMNLGLCWHKLGKMYERKAIDAFKKYIYYLITLSSNIRYSPTAYAFRKCTTHLYQSLINEQLNLSSPTTFNDPFDCPITELLKNGNEISSLILQAYKEGLKIACFTCNYKMPIIKENGGGEFERIREKKHENDQEEFLSPLMWAHYADSHKGICIKYSFTGALSNIGAEDNDIVSYFKDVKYSDSDILSYTKKDSINIEDAFFLKGKDWEYENELRYLQYDMNNVGNYGQTDIPNCVEAIYFGLKCSDGDQNTIMNIMKTKRFVKKDLNGTVTELPIKFYKMEIDQNHFGQLIAIEL